MSARSISGPRWHIEFTASNSDIADRHFKEEVDDRAKKIDPVIREYGHPIRVWIAKLPRDKDLDVFVHFSGYINGVGAEIKSNVKLVERRRVVTR